MNNKEGIDYVKIGDCIFVSESDKSLLMIYKVRGHEFVYFEHTD